MTAAPTQQWRLLQELRRAPELLERLAVDSGDELQLQRALRREYPDDLVRAALTLADLRRRAAAKFSRASALWLDRQGLEQSTAEPVAAHKAQRFHGLVWDYCCGIGSDAIALAGRGELVAVDRDPARCLAARWNSEAYGQEIAAVCADVETLPGREGLLHIDPDRRAGSGGRAIRLEDAVPGLDFLVRAAEEFAGGAIKVSPAANFAGKIPGAEIELVSLDGECKEATIWFGTLACDRPYRATILPAGITLAGSPLDIAVEVTPLGRFLYDPDPAVVRSGLVDLAAEQLGLTRLDEREEYLTGETLAISPLARGFEVLAQLPHSEKELRRYFRGADVGQLEIKCRHIPTQADVLRRRLPLAGSQAAVLVIVRVEGKARAVVCRRLPAGA